LVGQSPPKIKKGRILHPPLNQQIVFAKLFLNLRSSAQSAANMISTSSMIFPFAKESPQLTVDFP
jgi:hypothetical protein